MKVVTVYCQPKYHDALFLASITGLNERFNCKFNIDPRDQDQPILFADMVSGISIRIIMSALQPIIDSVDKASENPSLETKSKGL